MTSTTPAPSATLASPLRLPNGQVLGNRIMKSALSEGLAGADHLPGERIGALYRRWSEGGFGLVVTGNVMVDRRHLGEPGNVVLEADSDLDGFRSWAKTVQDGGSPMWMQLNHPGRQASPLASTHHAVAPSSRGVAIPGVPAPRALTDAEIGDIVERFATAAALADAAGFDGVQIHAAHGYLVSQFLSPLSNDRTDRWGGDIDGRMRFLLALVHAIRDAVRPGFALGVKLNSADFQRGGFTEDDSRAVIDAIADEDIDLLEISGGSYESPAMMGRAQSASTRAREAYFLDYAETVRAVAKDIPDRRHRWVPDPRHDGAGDRGRAVRRGRHRTTGRGAPGRGRCCPARRHHGAPRGIAAIARSRPGGGRADGTDGGGGAGSAVAHRSTAPDG